MEMLVRRMKADAIRPLPSATLSRGRTVVAMRCKNAMDGWADYVAKRGSVKPRAPWVQCGSDQQPGLDIATRSPIRRCTFDKRSIGFGDWSSRLSSAMRDGALGRPLSRTADIVAEGHRFRLFDARRRYCLNSSSRIS